MRLILLVILFISIPLVSAQDEASTYIVQPGDNLYRIALRYGVDIGELAQVNNITNQSRVLVGQTLTIPGLSTPDTGEEVFNPLIAGTPITHVVQQGEILSQIAERYGVTADQIIQANNIVNPNRILYGQELSIWTPNVADEEVAMPETVSNYTVQAGEHLAQIAGRYGLSWVTLAEINGLAEPDRLFAGQMLTIPGVNADGGIIDMGILTPYYDDEPEPTITVGKQIVIDLSQQRVYAYEDGMLLKSVVVSTGLPATPTVLGDFAIWHRTESQTMSGPGYYLPNVQWVQYFYQGYGIHGTYWHDNFGQPMSHGCVNMTNDDALWFYNFGEMGTPVHVQM